MPSKDCCPLFGPVMVRDCSTQVPRGFERAFTFNTRGKQTGARIVYHFPKARRGKPDVLEGATYALVKFCPFCGKKVGHAE